MSADQDHPLAAILYSEGAACDLLLAGVADRLACDGLRLAGAVQVNDRYDALCACDMTLRDLTSGKAIRISQRLGRYARGCRLDPAALEEAVGLAEQGLAGGADVVILNKFGKAEAAGHGFRPMIATAVEAGVPVLVGISEVNRPSWEAFAGGEGNVLEPTEQAILAWLERLALPRRRTA